MLDFTVTFANPRDAVELSDYLRDSARTIRITSPDDEDRARLADIADAVADQLGCGPEIWSSCSDEYGPCERHGETIAQREGASLRTADELSAVFVLDAQAAFPQDVTLSDEDRAFAESVDGWLDDADDVDRMNDLRDSVESKLPTGIVTYWEDGFRIVRILDTSPLAG